MDTSRIDGVKAPQHRGTPRSHLVDDFRHLIFGDALHRDVGHGLLLAPLEDLGVLAGADLVEDVVLVHGFLCLLWAGASACLAARGCGAGCPSGRVRVFCQVLRVPLLRRADLQAFAPARSKNEN